MKINKFTSLLGYEKTLIPMRAARAETALSKQYRYSLINSDGTDMGKEVLSEAEFIAYALQSGRRPQSYVERPCAKCQESYCVSEESCTKAKTLHKMTDGKYGTKITKTGYNFANYLINAGLVTYEAVQEQINNENTEKEKAAQEAALVLEEQKRKAEVEAKAEADYEKWLNETTAHYGTSVSENEKLLIQKDIFMHLVGIFNPRVVQLLVLIDNIENPRCRRDIISLLHNDNDASIKTFEHVTGIKLAKTYKARKAQLEKITKADYRDMKQYKPRKQAVEAEYNDIFYILSRESGYVFVECRGRLWRYGGFDFYIQKYGEGHYKATEGRSGLLVTINNKTLDDLKKDVADKVTGSGFSNAIDRSIEKYGLSPIYSPNNEAQ